MTRNVLVAACLFTAACGATYAEGAPMPMSRSDSSGSEATEVDGRFADLTGGKVDIDAVAMDRKLVRTGSVSVQVDAWEPFDTDLRAWLGEHGGYVSDVSVNRWEGQVGYATLTLRVPADGLDPLVSWTQEKVEVTQLSLSSEDVTAQWIDVEARLSALRQTESRLLVLVAESTATLADVLAAERELGRIRGDIESFERQQRSMADRVQLASVTVDVSVRTPYNSLVARSFGEQAGEAWTGSITALGTVARGLALLGVAAIPWLGVLLAGVVAMTGAVSVVVRRLRPR